MPFVFYNSSNVKRIIQNQPWSFDKHLVVLQKFDEFSKLKYLGAVWISCFPSPITLFSSPITQNWWVPRQKGVFDLFSVFVSITQFSNFLVMSYQN